MAEQFLSTPSARRATGREKMSCLSCEFLSTPSARRATPNTGNKIYDGVISIHALREEGDRCIMGRSRLPDISIHALREEGDCLERWTSQGIAISIHALREEGDLDVRGALAEYIKISIHALREEGDGCSHGCRYCFAQFLSTPSARRATESPCQ